MYVVRSINLVFKVGCNNKYKNRLRMNLNTTGVKNRMEEYQIFSMITSFQANVLVVR